MSDHPSFNLDMLADNMHTCACIYPLLHASVLQGHWSDDPLRNAAFNAKRVATDRCSIM
jgi:hypothetical protein